MYRATRLLLLTILLTGCIACGAQPAKETPASTEPVETTSGNGSPAEGAERSASDLFWGQLQALCGKAFEGAMVSTDEVDAAFADQPMTMHVRRCAEDRIEIPFHVGENRSRTWVLTRVEGGLKLQHDHRHEDGSEDVVTLYGGHTTEMGSAGAQHFPADDYSKELFTANGLDASVANTWSLEIEPGQRFSYILRRPERHFRADFDLSAPVAAPPAPWGHEESS